MNLTLKVWRQKNRHTPGRFVIYATPALNPNMSFLEMLDVVNEQLANGGEEPIAFDHDCREGICGTCSLVIDGKPHGPHKGVATCQTYMRSFSDGARTIATALKHYGAIVADNGSNWYLGGASDRRWNDSNLNQLKRIPGNAFQVVRSAAPIHTC